MLLQKGFFEHHLYACVPYTISNTDYLTAGNMFLRVNPEPDIWKAGAYYDKFFWIGSMFRNERPSPLHRQEFTVVDIYVRHAEQEDVAGFFLEILRHLERSLGLSALSQEPVSTMTYRQFHACKELPDGWIVVERYPVDESFYDGMLEENRSFKFEIFHKGKELVEIAACGKLGENHNPLQRVSDLSAVDTQALRKEFTGFGFGVERLMYLYGKLAK